MGTEALSLVLPVEPFPAARHKTRVVRGRVSHYKDPKYREWALTLGKYLDTVDLPNYGLGPVRGASLFLRTRPGRTKLDYPRGDVDNYEKALWDELTGRVFADDNQIVTWTSSKAWADEGCIVLYMEKA